MLSTKASVWFLLLLVDIPVSVSISCYSCNDVLDNEDCQNVITCGPGEVCFSRSDGFQTGLVTHTMGCEALQGPGPINDPGRITFCFHYCTESFCNLHLCRLVTRGPRCASCQNVDDPADCKNIKVCDPNQMCAISSVEVSGNAVFRMGCVEKKFCLNPGIVPVVGKRLAPTGHCSKCCTGDHCNMFVCDSGNRDNGEVRTLQLLNQDGCQDSATNCAMLVTFQGFHVFCSNFAWSSNCQKFCGICGQVAWSAWQTWGPCSVSCGVSGVMTRRRECVHMYDFQRNITCQGNEGQSQHCNNLPKCQVQTSTTTTPRPTPTTTTQTTTTTTTPTTSSTTTTTTTPKPTTSTTTTKPATTTSPISRDPITCQVCSGPSRLCDRLHHPTTCVYPNNFCVNHLTNLDSGARDLDRKCGDIDTCVHEWFNVTSDNDRCTTLDEHFVQTLAFECTFCCTTDNCNLPIVPEKDSWFKN